MRVLKLPEGSRTRKLTVNVGGERVSVSFKRDGTAEVGNERAAKLLEAIPMLSVVGDEEPDDNIEEVE